MSQFARPASVSDAVALLEHDPQARPLGGGTAIQILRQQGLLAPSTLVDLASIPEMHGIGEQDGSLRIGAMVTHREVETSALVRAAAPLLCQTYHHVANIRVRHTATVGGNLAHGDYRLDPPAALLVLGAALHLAGPTGRRTLPLSEFFVDLQQTALESGELVVDIRVPLAHPMRSSHFVKFSSLAANDWPCVGVAALLEWDDAGGLAAARLGVTAMASVPLLVDLADAPGLDETVLANMAVAAVAQAIDPLPDVRGSAAYKRQVCGAVVRDAIAAAWRAPREEARNP
jgi:carbon-monoxide dehydrogenase medium subunit